jgi:hypothetical protein
LAHATSRSSPSRAIYSAKCGTALTGDLPALLAVPDVDDPDDGRDKKTGRARFTVPRGYYAIDPDP